MRRNTKVVQIGNVPLGGKYPVRIQTMTNTSTLDTRSSVEQCIRIAHEGADYVRLTARNQKEVENLSTIKNELRKRNITIPLIADIHFSPRLAEIAATIVDKVRINPGNYGPQTTHENLIDSDHHFSAGLEKIMPQFISLLNVCKKYGTALRIGVNHGSLSQRIMRRYGDTPQGMVESALEFIRICHDEDFHQVVLSIKSSNTRIMVEAYRLLVGRLDKNKFNYPLHLGVTEAGLGAEGRIKSAVGIGTLLSEGIGDTIRVSLTEDPELEIPVAKEIVSYFADRKEPAPGKSPETLVRQPGSYFQRISTSIKNIGEQNPPVVISDFIASGENIHRFLERSGHSFTNNTPERGETVPDYVYLGDFLPTFPLPDTAGFILNYKKWINLKKIPENLYPIFDTEEFQDLDYPPEKLHFLRINIPSDEGIIDLLKQKTGRTSSGNDLVLVLTAKNTTGVYGQVSFINKLRANSILLPIVLSRDYETGNSESLQVKSGCDFGRFFIDAIGDGIWLKNSQPVPAKEITDISFGILQASRARITRPEYISCPSCGRTTFNLQKVTKEIQQATAHLKGIKIGIMGCIVNGPGEMADADYGYVGTGKGKVTLFKNNKIVRKGVSSGEAVHELINLIKESGDWIDH